MKREEKLERDYQSDKTDNTLGTNNNESKTHVGNSISEAAESKTETEESNTGTEVSLMQTVELKIETDELKTEFDNSVVQIDESKTETDEPNSIKETVRNGSGSQGTDVSIIGSKFAERNTVYNQPTVLKHNGYYTGMVGKLHLMPGDDNGSNIGCDTLETIDSKKEVDESKIQEDELKIETDESKEKDDQLNKMKKEIDTLQKNKAMIESKMQQMLAQMTNQVKNEKVKHNRTQSELKGKIAEVEQKYSDIEQERNDLKSQLLEAQQQNHSLKAKEKVIDDDMVISLSGVSLKKNWKKVFSNALVVVITAPEAVANWNECSDLFGNNYGWDFIRNKDNSLVTTENVNAILQFAEGKFKEKNYDSVIVLWTGHGDQYNLKMSDGSLYPRDKLYSFFSCPTKKTCLRMFVVGACNIAAQSSSSDTSAMQSNHVADGVHPDAMRVILNPNTTGGMTFGNLKDGEIFVGAFCHVMRKKLDTDVIWSIWSIISETHQELQRRKRSITHWNNPTESELNDNHRVAVSTAETIWPTLDSLKGFTFSKRDNPGQRGFVNLENVRFQYYSGN